MTLHYFVNRERRPDPVAGVLRRVAFPTEHRLPSSFEQLLQRLSRR